MGRKKKSKKKRTPYRVQRRRQLEAWGSKTPYTALGTDADITPEQLGEKYRNMVRDAPSTFSSHMWTDHYVDTSRESPAKFARWWTSFLRLHRFYRRGSRAFWNTEYGAALLTAMCDEAAAFLQEMPPQQFWANRPLDANSPGVSEAFAAVFMWPIVAHNTLAPGRVSDTIWEGWRVEGTPTLDARAYSMALVIEGIKSRLRDTAWRGDHVDSLVLTLLCLFPLPEGFRMRHARVGNLVFVPDETIHQAILAMNAWQFPLDQLPLPVSPFVVDLPGSVTADPVDHVRVGLEIWRPFDSASRICMELSVGSMSWIFDAPEETPLEFAPSFLRSRTGHDPSVTKEFDETGIFFLDYALQAALFHRLTSKTFDVSHHPLAYPGEEKTISITDIQRAVKQQKHADERAAPRIHWVLGHDHTYLYGPRDNPIRKKKWIEPYVRGEGNLSELFTDKTFVQLAEAGHFKQTLIAEEDNHA